MPDVAIPQGFRYVFWLPLMRELSKIFDFGLRERKKA